MPEALLEFARGLILAAALVYMVTGIAGRIMRGAR